MRNFIFIVSETVSAVFPVDTLDRIEYTSSTSITLSFVKESSTSTVVLSTEADRAHEAIEALSIVLAREKGNLLYNDYQLLGEKKIGVQKYRANNFASSYITGISSLTTPAAATSTTETVFTTVRNTSGATLSKGTPVHATGVTGEVADVIAARADTASAMPATYVLNADVANNQTAQAIIVGVIENIDTSSFSAGDVVYVAAAGGFTNVKPTGTNLIQNLGVVTKSNVSTGSGVVLGSGRSNDLPNIPNGQAWIGNASGLPTATTLSTVATTGALSDLSGTSDDITEGTTNLFLTSAEETKLGFISVTQAVDLDTMESDIATNNAKVSNVTTDLTTTHASSTITVNSSDGTDATINGATTSLAGVMTEADKTKLDGIETSADVTDETNVTDALDGATLTDLGTPASGDLILLQDASDSNNLKVAQFSTFGGGGGGGTITALNNQAADRLTTIGATTTELDGEANLTFDGTTLTVAGEMKAEQVYVNVRFTGTPSNGAFLDGARIGRGFFSTGSITAGSVYYLGASAWTLADADAASTGSGLLAVATDAGSATEVLLEGAVKLNANTGYSGASKGDVLYLSLTAGEVTNDISSYTTGDIVRVLGYVLDATNGYIYFNPDNTWLEI